MVWLLHLPPTLLLYRNNNTKETHLKIIYAAMKHETVHVDDTYITLKKETQKGLCYVQSCSSSSQIYIQRATNHAWSDSISPACFQFYSALMIFTQLHITKEKHPLFF